MGKSSKKTAAKSGKKAELVDATPAKPLNKGKRGAENSVKDPMHTKRKKKVEVNKIEVESKNVVEALSEDTSMSEQPEVALVTNGLPETTPAVAASNGHRASEEKDTSGGDIDNETKDAENAVKVVDDLELEKAHDEDDEICTKAPSTAEQTLDGNLSAQDAEKDEKSIEDEEDDDVDEAENETKEAISPEDDEASSEEAGEPVLKDEDTEMTDDGKVIPDEEDEPKTPHDKKTVFIGNIPYSAKKADIEMLFKDIGEIVDVRFAVHNEKFKGHGHVEFASNELAEKAVQELNGKKLKGRPLRLEMARERATHPSVKEEPSSKKSKESSVHTVFVRGFNKSAAESEIRDSLEEFFGGCGEIKRIRIPKDGDEDAFKGFAYLDFKDAEAFNQALKLSGSEFGDFTLTVAEARPRDPTDGRHGGGRGGGRGRGGRGGDRGRGGRGGRDGGRGWGRGRGGRGRGSD